MLVNVIEPRGAMPPQLESNLDYMPQTEISLQTILQETHTAAITALEFSPDGKFLASGGDDGAILIFSTSSWMPVKRYLDVSPVRALVWDHKKNYLLLSGHQSGDVHVVTMDRSMVCPAY